VIGRPDADVSRTAAAAVVSARRPPMTGSRPTKTPMSDDERPSGDREKQQFIDVAERLAKSNDAAEQARLVDELARLTFGD
jgi:hypothetical protein